MTIRLHRGKGRAVSKPNVREQIATMEYEDWIVDFCKSHEIKRPNRGSYADIIVKCLYGNLQKEINVVERMRVKITKCENGLSDLLVICGNVGEYIGYDCGTMDKCTKAREALEWKV